MTRSPIVHQIRSMSTLVLIARCLAQRIIDFRTDNRNRPNLYNEPRHPISWRNRMSAPLTARLLALWYYEKYNRVFR